MAGKSLSRLSNDAMAETVKDVTELFQSPENRAGLAAVIGTTALLARTRLPFPMVLFVALTAGSVAELAYARYLGDVIARETDR